MMFDPAAMVWFDGELPKELSPFQDQLTELVHGIPAWPLWMTLYPQTGEIVVQQPWSDSELTHVPLPADFPTWSVYESQLLMACLLSGINFASWEDLVKEGHTQFAPPQVVLHAYLADVKDAPMYFANMAAEAAEFEAAMNFAAPTPIDDLLGEGMSMLMSGGAAASQCGLIAYNRLEAVTNDFVLEWLSETNATYEVAAITDLTTNNWVQLATRYPAAANTNLTGYTDVGGATNELRFYKVAKTGISIGLCPSNTLSGLVEIPVQVGMPDNQRLEGVYFLLDGEPPTSVLNPKPPFKFETAGTWNTTLVSNGWHTVQAFAVYRDTGQDDGSGYSTYGSQIVSVQTSNAIVFTHPVSTFGTTLVVRAFVALTNADWTVKINSPSNIVLQTFSGTTSNSTIEVFWDGKDTNGVQFADQFVQVDVTAISQIESGFCLLQLTVVTNSAGTVIYAEAPMKPFPQQFLVSYEMLFQNGSAGQIQFNNMVDQIALFIIAEGIGPYERQGDGTGVRGTTKIADTAASWTSWVNSLLTPGSVFHFSHGSPSSLGSEPASGRGVYVEDMQNFLVNGNFTGYPLFLHPFRFVFLDGCTTSEGNWSVAFGIERKKTTAAEYAQNGLRPRAFMGFKTLKAFRCGSQFCADHENFVLDFFTRWSTGQTLRLAVDNSLPGGGFTPPIIWGDDQLTWNP